MRIRVETADTLEHLLPPPADGGEASIEVVMGATVSDALETLAIAANEPLLTLVNDAVVPSHARAERVLIEGDVLVLLPPLKGG